MALVSDITPYDPTYVTPDRQHEDGAKWERWPICSSLDDPRLGLTYGQLSTTLRTAPAAEAWDQSTAAELAQAVWLLLSHKAGTAINARVALPPWGKVVMQVAVTRLPGEEAPPFPRFAQQERDLTERQRPGVGFGGVRTMWRRMIDAGPFTDVHATDDRARWTVKHIADYDALDTAWDEAQLAPSEARSEPHYPLPLLPLELLSAMFPARRSQYGIAIPALWELVASLLFAGPAVVRLRGQQLLANLSRSEIARTTLRGCQSHINGFSAAATAISRWQAVTRPWETPMRVTLTAAARKRAGRGTDRTAPSLARARAARADARRRLGRSRETRRSAWAECREQSRLKRILLLEITTQTLSRVNEVTSRTVAHYDPRHDFGDGLIWPAIFFQASKDISGNITPIHKPIHPLTASALDEWLSEWGLSRKSDPLFPASAMQLHEPMDPQAASSFFSGREGTPTIPRPGRSRGPGQGIHSLKHLGEQLAFGVGQEFLRTNPSWEERITPQVFPDSAAFHFFRDEVHQYKDLEAHRERWSTRALLGVPRQGIPGVIDLFMGDAGARRVWDYEAVRSCLSRIEQATRRAEAARYELEAAERELRRCTASLTAAPTVTEIEEHNPMRAIVLLQRRLEDAADRDAVRDRADAARDRRHTAELARNEADHASKEARLNLKAIQAAGPSVILPDWTPLDDRAAEEEAFEEALARVRAELASTAVDSRLECPATPEVMLRVREVVNLNEWAAVWGVHDKTVRRHVSGERRAPIPLDGAVVKLGARLRFIDIAALFEGWQNRLTLSQREMLEQILRIPLGQTRFGGPTAKDEQLAAAPRQSPGPEVSWPNPSSSETVAATP